MEKSNLWYFEEVNLFDILCPHKVKAHRQKRVHIFKEFKKNEFIYFESEHSTNIYLIVKGKVKVLKYTEDGEEQVKAVLTRGEIFGELAMLGEERRTDYAQVAEEPTVICPMSVEDLQDLMKENRPLSIKIYRLIGLRIKKLERQIQILVYKDVKTRLFEFLRDLMAEKGILENDSVVVELPYTQKISLI